MVAELLEGNEKEMITITQNSNGFDIHGHAGYAPKGQDIVCAGVTTLFQTLIESMEKLTRDRIQTNIQPGNVSVSYGNLSEAGKLLVDSFFIGVSQISGEFPECVNKI